MQENDDLELISAAAKEAGGVALKYFRSDPDVWFKNGTSPVSEADIAVDKCLRERLKEARPNYGWLSEESEDDRSRLGEQPVFVVDPIDGTRAFIKGDDQWCVSVAVVREGRTVAGTLYSPARSELFTASANGAAKCNGHTIHVADRNQDAKVAAPNSLFRKLADHWAERRERADHIPSLAYRLAMVSDGRLAATLVKPNAHDWDLAAADIILSRAGGALVDQDGQPPRYDRPETTHGILIASSGDLLPDLLKAVGKISL